MPGLLDDYSQLLQAYPRANAFFQSLGNNIDQTIPKMSDYTNSDKMLNFALGTVKGSRKDDLPNAHDEYMMRNQALIDMLKSKQLELEAFLNGASKTKPTGIDNLLNAGQRAYNSNRAISDYQKSLLGK